MTECALCQRKVDIPFACVYCGQYFCMEHRLPEAHRCPKLPPPSWELRARRYEEQYIIISPTQVASSMSPPIVDIPPQPATRPERRRYSLSTLLACLLLGIFLSGSISTGYFLYKAVPDAYARGMALGEVQGYSLGEAQGYAKGFREGEVAGNSTGFELGYKSGYDQGFKKGEERGYSIGYTAGQKNGETTGYTKGYDDGYKKGINELEKYGFTIRNPTYSEAIEFIRINEVNKNKYDPESYTCFEFTADFLDAAYTQGYKAGFVYLEFPDGAHAIVAFETIDRGIIFVEPQTDELVDIRVGGIYLGDLIIAYRIIW